MIYPMFAMFLLTSCIGIYALFTRISAVKSRAVNAKSFKLMDGNFPEKIVATTRCFNNQFELPVLFYVVSLAYMIIGLANNSVIVALAWAFVVSRAIHAFIHVSYNHVLHRVIAFWFGFLVLAALWIHLLIAFRTT